MLEEERPNPVRVKRGEPFSVIPDFTGVPQNIGVGGNSKCLHGFS